MATQRQCELALDLHESRLGQLSNVVGLGIVSVSDIGDEEDLAVAVYVCHKVPISELSAADIVPPTLEVSDEGGGLEVPTCVIEQGEVTLEEPGG